MTVAKPVSQDVRSFEIFDGNVAAYLSVDLEARVPGYLTKIAFQDGAPVKKDQLLFVIEQDQYAQQVNLTKAVFEEAKIEISEKQLATFTVEPCKEKKRRDGGLRESAPGLCRAGRGLPRPP